MSAKYNNTLIEYTDKPDMWEDVILSALFEFVSGMEDTDEQTANKALLALAPARWSAALMYVSKKVFKSGVINLKRDKKSYDLGKICYLSDLYIYISSMYNKEPKIIDFSYLIGCSVEILYLWDKDIKLNYLDNPDLYYSNIKDSHFNNIDNNSNDDDYIYINNKGVYNNSNIDDSCSALSNNVTFNINNFFKNIKQASENFLEGALVTSPGSPVGKLAALNHVHGWASEAEAQGLEVQRSDNLQAIAQRMGIKSLPEPPTQEKKT